MCECEIKTSRFGWMSGDFDLAIFKSEYYVSECKFSDYLCVHRPAIPNTLNNRSGNMYVPEKYLLM